MTNGEARLREAVKALKSYGKLLSSYETRCFANDFDLERGKEVTALAEQLAALAAPVQADAVTDAARVSGGGSLGHATSTLPTCIPESVQGEVGAGEPSVAGNYDGTFWAFTRRAGVLLEDEQSKPLPNNALIAFLCDAIRIAREAVAIDAEQRAARPEVGAGIESPDKLTMASITCPDCKAIHPIGGCTDYLREKRLARSVAARPDVADSHLLDKLNEAIVDTIYLDNGRVIDIKGADIRTEIKRWLGILKPL